MPSWVDRNMKVVIVARAGMSTGQAVTSIVTALYLASIGFSATEIGVLFVAITAASALMSTTIGLFADRWGRRPFLVVVPLLTAGAGVVYAYNRDTTVLFVVAAAGAFGRGSGAGGNVGPYQPAEAALVGETVDDDHRVAAFGWLAFSSSLGALVGGLATQLVRTTSGMTPAQATAAYRPAFLLAAALAVFAGLIALAIREPPRQPPASSTRPGLRWPRQSWPALWRFWVANSINGAGLGMFGPFVSYWLFRRYGATPATIGVLFALVNAGSLASTLTAAGVARRVGTVRAIVVVRALSGLLIVPMVLAPVFWAAGGVYFVRMIVQRVSLPLRRSFTQDLADPDERASVAALANLPSQATMASGQAAAGWMFDEVSLAAPFVLSAGFQLVNACLYWMLFTRHPPRPARKADTASPLTQDHAHGLPASGPAPATMATPRPPWPPTGPATPGTLSPAQGSHDLAARPVLAAAPPTDPDDRPVPGGDDQGLGRVDLGDRADPRHTQ